MSFSERLAVAPEEYSSKFNSVAWGRQSDKQPWWPVLVFDLNALQHPHHPGQFNGVTKGSEAAFEENKWTVSFYGYKSAPQYDFISESDLMEWGTGIKENAHNAKQSKVNANYFTLGFEEAKADLLLDEKDRMSWIRPYEEDELVLEQSESEEEEEEEEQEDEYEKAKAVVMQYRSIYATLSITNQDNEASLKAYHEEEEICESTLLFHCRFPDLAYHSILRDYLVVSDYGVLDTAVSSNSNPNLRTHYYNMLAGISWEKFLFLNNVNLQKKGSKKFSLETNWSMVLIRWMKKRKFKMPEGLDENLAGPGFDHAYSHSDGRIHVRCTRLSLLEQFMESNMYGPVLTMVKHGFSNDGLAVLEWSISENQLAIVEWLHQHRDLDLKCSIPGYVNFTPLMAAIGCKASTSNLRSHFIPRWVLKDRTQLIKYIVEEGMADASGISHEDLIYCSRKNCGVDVMEYLIEQLDIDPLAIVWRRRELRQYFEHWAKTKK